MDRKSILKRFAESEPSKLNKNKRTSQMPKKQKKVSRKISVIIDGVSHNVTLFPPQGREKSWYAYWSGLPTRKSTKQRDYDEAVKAIGIMLRNGGQFSPAPVEPMTDDEFIEIQMSYYRRCKAKKGTIEACLEAITAFRDIAGVSPVALATPDDCARFQDIAVSMPRNWRVPMNEETRKKQKEDGRRITEVTVHKWSTALRAAFNRANKNAGKKCERNVVSDERLLISNPWDHFTWIKCENTKDVRQFSADELLALLKHLESDFPSMNIPSLLSKTFFWSCARRKEIVSLTWDQLRPRDGEIHFDIVGKWGIRRWFQIPESLYKDLLTIKTDSPFVFGAYPQQLVEHHRLSGHPQFAQRVKRHFDPSNLGDWLYHQIRHWSEALPGGAACIHVFRKTGLQGVVDGEYELERKVASDAGVSVKVMRKHYTPEQERQFLGKSNRTYQRIVNGQSDEVLRKYGYVAPSVDPLLVKLEEAQQTKDWREVERLARELGRRDAS